MMVSNVIVAGVVIVAILLVLFYLSPYSDIDHVDCITPTNVPNPAGAELSPFCGVEVVPFPESLFIPPFPFRSRDSEFVDFCRRNIPTVEDSCNVTVTKTMIETLSSVDDEYSCVYFVNNYTSTISLDKFAEPLTPQDTQAITLFNLDMIYLKGFAVSITSGPFDYDSSWAPLDYQNCTDLKTRLR